MLQLGIDFGYQTAKIACVRHGFFGPRLIATGQVTIPNQSISKQGLNHSPELRQAIEQGLKTVTPHLHRGTRVVSAIPASLVLTKRLELPPMPLAELTQSIALEASQSFPVAAEELIIDWLIAPNPVATNAATKPTTVAIMAMGAPRPLANSFVTFFSELGLDLRALEMKPIANARAVTETNPTGRYLLADIGAIETSLVVVNQGIVEHVASVALGGNSLTNPSQIKEKQSLSLPTELMPVLGTDRKSQSKRVSSTNAKNLTRETVGPLVEQIEQVIKFTNQHLRGPILSELRICGGGAQASGLANILSELTSLKTTLANPLTQFHSLDKTNSQTVLPMTTAIGLALRKESL